MNLQQLKQVYLDKIANIYSKGNLGLTAFGVCQAMRVGISGEAERVFKLWYDRKYGTTRTWASYPYYCSPANKDERSGTNLRSMRVGLICQFENSMYYKMNRHIFENEKSTS